MLPSSPLSARKQIQRVEPGCWEQPQCSSPQQPKAQGRSPQASHRWRILEQKNTVRIFSAGTHKWSLPDILYPGFIVLGWLPYCLPAAVPTWGRWQTVVGCSQCHRPIGFFVDKKIRSYLPGLWFCAEHEANCFSSRWGSQARGVLSRLGTQTWQNRWDYSHLVDEKSELRQSVQDTFSSREGKPIFRCPPDPDIVSYLFLPWDHSHLCFL